MLTVRAKSFFFDRAAVMNALRRGERQALSKAGAFVRQRAKSLIRKRKAISQPGQPPSSHVGTLRKFIWFAFDPAHRSVVVGPIRTNQAFLDRHRQPVTGTVPSTLEFGGRITIREWQLSGGGWARADLRLRRTMAQRQKRFRTATIAPRPFMAPALRLERAVLPKCWRNSVKGAA